MATTSKYLAAPAGKIYIAPRNASGKTGGFTWLGDCDGFKITTSQSALDWEESYTTARGTAGHVITKSDYSLEVSIRNIDGENLARAFYGTSSEVAAGSVVGEAVTAYNGSRFALKYQGVSSVVVKKGATTLVEGTDYTVDAEFGAIEILPGSTQVTGSTGVALTVDYSHAKVVRSKLMTQGQKEYSFRIEYKSSDSDLPQVAEIHRVPLDMAASIDLIGTGINTLVVKGKLLPAEEQAAGESKYFTNSSQA